MKFLDNIEVFFLNVLIIFTQNPREPVYQSILFGPPNNILHKEFRF